MIYLLIIAVFAFAWTFPRTTWMLWWLGLVAFCWTLSQQAQAAPWPTRDGWLLIGSVCTQIDMTPVSYIAKLDNVLSFVRSEKATVEVYDVRFRIGGTQSYQFFSSAYACQLRARQIGASADHK